MEKEKKKRKKGVNETAFNIVQRATGGNVVGENQADDTNQDQKPFNKNPAAVALGRLGGIKGGPARAKKLTKEQRREIARNAARARWKKSKH